MPSPPTDSASGATIRGPRFMVCTNGTRSSRSSLTYLPSRTCGTLFGPGLREQPGRWHSEQLARRPGIQKLVHHPRPTGGRAGRRPPPSPSRRAGVATDESPDEIPPAESSVWQLIGHCRWGRGRTGAEQRVGTSASGSPGRRRARLLGAALHPPHPPHPYSYAGLRRFPYPPHRVCVADENRPVLAQPCCARLRGAIETRKETET